jgi:PTS system mannose-specific IIA component
LSVALLIVTHGNIGKSIHDAAVLVIGSCPLRTAFIPVADNCQPEQSIDEAKSMIAEMDTGDGVLILTDMYGSTPSNIACALQRMNVKVVAGLNLPMLMRILNYPTLPLQRLAEKAVSGGKEGILAFQAPSASDATQRN